jgi:hypothetical protein
MKLSAICLRSMVARPTLSLPYAKALNKVGWANPEESRCSFGSRKNSAKRRGERKIEDPGPGVWLSQLRHRRAEILQSEMFACHAVGRTAR